MNNIKKERKKKLHKFMQYYDLCKYLYDSYTEGYFQSNYN